MKKNLLLYIIIGFLIVMNGFFLFKHFGTSNLGGPQRVSPENFIANQLKFKATQLQKFEEIEKVHREKINTVRRNIADSMDALLRKISDEDFNDTDVEAITAQIANLEKAKAMETFRFFNAIGEICNEQQRERFKKIINDGLQRQGPPDGNRPAGDSGRERRRPPPPGNQEKF